MQLRLTTLLFLAVAAAAAMPACSCGSDTDPGGPGGPGAGGSGGGTSQVSSVRVEPAAVTIDVELGGAAPTQAYQAFATVNGQETEVTADCSWSLDTAFGSMAGATLTPARRGGQTQVAAVCSGVTGTSELTLNLTGTVIAGMATPADAPDLLDAATLTDDPARSPSIVYPLEGAIAPRNLPPIDVQWQPAQNDLFRLGLSATHLDVDIYTSDISVMLSQIDWEAIASTAAGEDLRIEVEGLLQAEPGAKFAGTPVTFRISNDVLDKTAIYWWASSSGQLINQTFGNTSAPGQIIDRCTSCHSVSRSGSRIGYSRCVNDNCGDIRVGFMRYDKQSASWVETINADTHSPVIVGSYTTFAPLGNPFPSDAQSVALVTMSGGFLQLYDPDTGMVVDSNAEEMSAQLGGQPRAALMPDWSPDGSRVVFSSTPNAGQWIDLSQGAIAAMDYTYENGAHVFGEPQLLVNGPIELPSGSYDNFFFPSFSPDGQYIVFNGARAAWRSNPATAAGQRLMLTSASGEWVVELAAMNGGGDLDITWPHWAPSTQGDYLWVVFSSQRDYGHKLTLGNTNPGCVANGVNQCKQIWIGAIDRQKLAGGMPQDPSGAPVWLPGQEITANNISPYWTVPTTEIPQ